MRTFLPRNKAFIGAKGYIARNYRNPAHDNSVLPKLLTDFRVK